MTPRQREVLSFIVDRYIAGGPLPTNRELMDRFRWKSSAASFGHVTALEESGAIRRATGSPRYGLVKTHPVVAEMLRSAA